MVSGLLPERLSHPPFYIEIHFVYKRTYWYVCYRGDRNHVVELLISQQTFKIASSTAFLCRSAI